MTYLGESLPGDTNGDRIVDLADLNAVRNHFGEAGESVPGDTYPFDGIVDLADVNAVRDHFGSARGARSTPEPSSLCLFVIGVAVLQRIHNLNQIRRQMRSATPRRRLL